MDEIEFLRQLSVASGVAPLAEQLDYTGACRQAINAKANLVIEMDGGAGKTYGYLVPAMYEAVDTSSPAIIATSTVANRNQIEDAQKAINAFAVKIGHRIANIPFVNYRSVHDYCSVARIENLLSRLRDIRAPNVVISELAAILDAADIGKPVLVDIVMPEPIMFDEKIYIDHDDIAISLRDQYPDYLQQERMLLMKAIDGPAVVLVTHAMLAKHRKLRAKIRGAEAAAVVIDEADRLLALNFLSNTNVALSDIAFVINTLRDVHNLDVSDCDTAFKALAIAVDAARPSQAVSTVMLHRESMPDVVCDAVFATLHTAIDKVTQLADTFEEMPRDVADGDLASERKDRLFSYQLDDTLGSMSLFKEQFVPTYRTEIYRLKNDTDIRLFAKWNDDREPSLHVVTGTPGRAMKWVFAASVPTVLTTALIATEHRQFAAEIGLSGERHAAGGEIRMQKYGDMHFSYYTGMPQPVTASGHRRSFTSLTVSQDYLKAAATEIRAAYKPESRMLVVAPAYRDIDFINQELADMPVERHVQQRGGNIAALRQQLIERPGILSTVLWEGYNITAPEPRPDGRRGLLDTIVIVRLPFAVPNDMLEQTLSHIYGPRATQWLWARQTTDVIRKVYQVACRGVRGPVDRCEILILDPRFPPPLALLRLNPLLQCKPHHKGLVRAIPDRFVNNSRNFTWRKHNA